MKHLLILSLLALGCKKDSPPDEGGNKVIYTIQCDYCTAILDTRSRTRTINVTGFYQLGEINSLPVINLSVSGANVSSSIKVNGNYLHKAIGSGSFKIQIN